ncbi:hypothetical protein [Paenarthrobacter sp. Z7-10]|uniref:hypothetical protein n=1 Tax=Paenarthrobacter sp. Z7-10 TaxID=2787635 RepID=UPI0022A9AB83|nr:hypothetical protein [Paenarthrobacter sp. Z7-10]
MTDNVTRHSGDMVDVAEKFDLAVATLAIGPNRIQRRLADAYLAHLTARTYPSGSLPCEVENLLDSLDQRLATVPAAAMHSVYETGADLLTDEDATELARQILDARHVLWSESEAHPR